MKSQVTWDLRVIIQNTCCETHWHSAGSRRGNLHQPVVTRSGVPQASADNIPLSKEERCRSTDSELCRKSPFLIGRTFLREPSWKYSSKLYSGSRKLRSTCSGNFRHIRRSLLLNGWEQSSPVDEEKIKIKMDDGVARFFTRFGGNLFICWLVGGAALSRRPRMR